MSLWYTPIHEITFQDVDDFCKAGWEESVRLDYKGEWPNDLAKTMAAMANTLGGMIIIGVDADKNSNKPKWPPIHLAPPRTGFPMDSGLSERVYQVARDSIYPPLLSEVSPVIDNHLAPGQAILVIRIPESKDAPHATDQKKNVYLYERTGNQNFAHRHADIDYVERLIRRRQKHEVDREEMLASAIKRARYRLPIADKPARWASVIPYYPWRPLATPESCFQFHELSWSLREMSYGGYDRHQRAPGGSFCVSYDRSAEDKRSPIACSSVSTKGHVFGINLAVENRQPHDSHDSPDPFIDYDLTKNLLMCVISGANAFYADKAVEAPAYVMLSLGIINPLNTRMRIARTFIDYNPFLFPDPQFRADVTVLGIDQADPTVIAEPLLEQFRFGFNVTKS